MVNTKREVDWEERLRILEDYIQVLVDSNHRYPFTKSVILQGLTKYEYMCERSSVDVQDPKYMPLYRQRTPRQIERTLLKYIEPIVWYKGSNLGDPFKKTWRK